MIIDIVGANLDISVKYGQLGINGQTTTFGRGLVLALIDQKTKELIFRQIYDTYTYTDNSTALLNKLKTVTNELVILLSSDAIHYSQTRDETNYYQAVINYLANFGMSSTDISGMLNASYRTSFALIGRRGLSQGTAQCKWSRTEEVYLQEILY